MYLLSRALLLLAFLLPVISWSNTGYVCPKLNMEIIREDVGEMKTLVIRNTEDGNFKYNDHLVLSKGADTQSYQQRVGTYNVLLDQALMNFPYMPEFVLVYHAIRGGSLYRQGFKALEGEGKPVKLSKMYCKALIKAIMNY